MRPRDLAHPMPEATPIPIVILPGLDGTGDLFKDFAEALGPGFRTIVVRYPTDVALDYAGLEPLVRAALPADEPFVLLAESFSGPLGVSLAASAPPGLRGLVLSASFVHNPHPLLPSLMPLVARMPFSKVPKNALLWWFLGGYSTPALRRQLMDVIFRVAPDVLRSRLHTVRHADAREALVHLDIPVLYLQASQDRVVPRQASELVARLRPRTRVVRFQAPHFLLQSAPAKAAETVATFAREVI